MSLLVLMLQYALFHLNASIPPIVLPLLLIFPCLTPIHTIIDSSSAFECDLICESGLCTKTPTISRASPSGWVKRRVILQAGKGKLMLKVVMMKS